MKIYAVVNQKGGVGKTTSVISLASYLAEKHKVLIVDMDPQANATSGLGFDKTKELSTYELLLREATPAEVKQTHPKYQLDILASNPALSGAEIELVSAIGREYRLREALATIEGEYDYVLIDCPPSLGLLTINALTAARDGVLIPVQCEYLALEGLSQLDKTVKMVKQYLNPALDIRGLIMTMYDNRTNLSREVVEEVRNFFPGKVFRAIIPRNVRLSEAPSHGEPISGYAPASAGAVAYKYLAAEIVKGDKQKKK